MMDNCDRFKLFLEIIGYMVRFRKLYFLGCSVVVYILFLLGKFFNF